MDKKNLEYIRKKIKTMMLDGVTDEMITQADKEIKKDSCRPLKIIDKLEYQLEMVHVSLVKQNFVLAEVICNNQLDTALLDIPFLLEADYRLIIIPLKEAFLTGRSYLSPNLWTCDCKSHYIRSRLCPQCDTCGQTIWKSKQILPPMTELMNKIRRIK